MVLRSKLERAHAHDGVAAAMAMDAQQREQGEMSWVGDDQWRTLVREAARLRQLSGQPQIRVLVGDHSILLMGDEHDVVGLVFVKGHPIVKSVVRMVRQLFRHAEKGRRASAIRPSAPAAAAQAPAAQAPAPAAPMPPRPMDTAMRVPPAPSSPR